MALIEGWFPPTREHWELTLSLWQWFPALMIFQLFSGWYPMGKTSYQSRLNLPGKIGWVTMEAPGVTNLLYIMFTLPTRQGIRSLPWPNWLMAGLFVSYPLSFFQHLLGVPDGVSGGCFFPLHGLNDGQTLHYINRAFLTPLLNQSMSPIHIVPWMSAFAFQLSNSICLGGWLAGYGPTSFSDWQGDAPRFLVPRIEVGMMIWAVALMANLYHDEELREIRRAAARSQRRRQEAQGETVQKKPVDKVYQVPENGLFRLILYPHYFTEWIEWTGYWVIGGLGCAPARMFLVNEIAAMLPRAVRGKQWYIARFGKERIGNKKAVIPWIV